MRDVLIDVTRLLSRLRQGRLATGVDRVSLAYVEHYGHRAQVLVRRAKRCFVLSAAVSDRLFQQLLSSAESLDPNIWRIVVKDLMTGGIQRKLEGRFLLNTGHSGLEHCVYSNLISRYHVRPLFLIHDLIPITHPEYCRPGERDHHVSRMNNAIQMASGIITNSEATLDSLSKFARSKGRVLPPATAAALAPGLLLCEPGNRPLPQPYFVIVGTIEPRKNHWLLLHLWRNLVERLAERAPRLVVIGQRGWECENVVDMLERCEPLKGFVVEHSTCSDADLVTYLCHAQALLFPSFAEGYGMPIIEALALGVPVIASDLPVFREIAGKIPEYIDPLDGKRWEDVVEKYSIGHSEMRAAQLQRMSKFEKIPTWSDHFAKVDELMERLSTLG